MKNSSKYILLLSFVSFLFAVSCVKDRGNYDLVDIPTVEVSNYNATADGKPLEVYEDNTIYLEKGNLLVIDPTFDMSGWDKPTFTWSFIIPEQSSASDYIKPVEIGNEKKLTYKFNHEAGSYVLSLVIASGSHKEYVNFKVSIEKIRGMIVLYKNADGNGDYSVFNTGELDAKIQGQIIFSKICATYNNGRMIKNPKFVTIDSGSANYMIGTSSTIEEHNSKTLELVSDDYQRLFFTGEAPKAPFSPDLLRVERAGGTQFDAGFLFVNNSLYAKTKSSSGGLNKYGLFPENKTDKYAPHIILAGTTSTYDPKIAFNSTKKAFQLLDARGYGIEFFGIVQTYYPSEILGVGEVLVSDTKMDLVSMGKVNSKYLCAVMKDASSALHFVNFTYPKKNSAGTTESTFVSKTALASYAGVNESTVWEYGSRGDYAFYAVNNKLYIFNVSSKIAVESELGFENSEKIAQMKLLKDDTNEKYNGGLLFIATNNNGVGKVYQYKINPLSGKLDTETVKVLEGFDTIVDMCLVK